MANVFALTKITTCTKSKFSLKSYLLYTAAKILYIIYVFLFCTVADPEPGSGAFLTPRSGMGRKSASGSGMNNPDHIF
jgi:hypothetical protein